MKVLHVLDHSIPYFSGYSFRSEYIIRNQKKLEINAIVLTSLKHENSSENFEVIDGIKYYRTFVKNKSSFKWQYPFFREFFQIIQLKNRILQIIDREQIEIIHAHSPSLNGIAAYLSGRKSGIPVVYEVRAFWEDAAVDHGTFRENSFKYKISKAIETWLFKKVTWLFTICEGLKSDIIKRGLLESKITVIPNGVDTTKFYPIATDEIIKKRLSLNGKHVLGFIGSFYHYEGIENLILLIELLIKERRDIKLILVGGGPEFNKIRDLILKKNLSDDIILTGKVPHNEILNYYSIIDIFLYPRIKMRLTDLVTPLKPLEAMAMEKIVIGSDVGGIRELIKHRKTGMIFPQNDIGELNRLVLGILENEKLAYNLRTNAKKYILENRNWHDIVKNYLKVYQTFYSK